MSTTAFESFAIIAKDARDFVQTSRRLRAPHRVRTPTLAITPTTEAGKTPIRNNFMKFWWLLWSGAATSTRNFMIIDDRSALRKINSGLKSVASTFFEALTVIGSVVSIAGFIAQFVGLRSSHWSLSIAQLSATIAMTLLRAIERRSLVERPSSHRLTPGYELDWLATGVTTSQDRERFWKYFGSGAMKDILGLTTLSSYLLPAGRSEGEINWSVLTGDKARARGCFGPAPNNAHTDSQNLIKSRQRLGYLSRWTGPSSELAVALASSIDQVMNSLFPGDKSSKFVWSLNTHFGEENHWIDLGVMKQSKKPWVSDSAELESLLSLWIYHAIESERSDNEHERVQIIAGNPHPSRPTANSPLAPGARNLSEGDWLRHGDTGLQRQNLQFLGPDTPCLRRDLQWWTRSVPGELLRVITKESDSTLPYPKMSSSEIQYSQVTGFSKLSNSKDPFFRSHNIYHFDNDRYRFQSAHSSTSSPQGPTRLLDDISLRKYPERRKMQYESETVPFNEIETSDKTPPVGYPEPSLAIMMDTRRDVAYAQHIFSAFMWSVAEKVQTIKGQTTARQRSIFNSPTAWDTVELENTTLSQIALAVEKSGLAKNTADAYLCILPPLSLANKLPVSSAVDSFVQNIKGREADSTLGELGPAYLELLRFATRFGPGSNGLLCPLHIKSVAVVVEYYRTVSLTARLLTAQLRDDKSLYNLKDELGEKLRRCNPEVMDVILTLLRNQDRLDDPESGLEGILPIASLLPSYDHADGKLTGYMCYTYQHEDVIFPRYGPDIGPSRVYDDVDLIGWSPLHYLANAPKERVEEMK